MIGGHATQLNLITMCGICGCASQVALRPEDFEQVRQINAHLRHRGPDGDGAYSESQVMLAMRRLSIIDPAGGWQPLYNEDRSIILVANGEIYNAPELRERLEHSGHAFRTGSDCEVILHLYEESGAQCLHWLRGMFAFALWDQRRRRLFLARDRMGEKPLYLYQAPGRLLFASELKALIAAGVVPFELDPVAIDQFFHYQYVPEPRTPVRGVRKLGAGHRLILDVETWSIQEEPYWRMEDAPPISGEPVDLIREQLDQVGDLVIRSDVPVGVALSGGLDSSGIAAVAAAKSRGNIEAFTVGYSGQLENDERVDAEAFARYLKIPIHQVELSVGAMVDDFPVLTLLRDDPVADIAGYGYYAVMQLAARHGTRVMLQGHGGDELFWGYKWVQNAAAPPRQGLFDQPCELNPRGVLRLAGAWARQARRYWKPRTRRWRGGYTGVVPGFYMRMPDFIDATPALRRLYHPHFIDSQEFLHPLVCGASEAVATDIAVTALISSTYLRGNGLVQSDRLAMACSVEPRVPFVDYRLIETVIGLRKTSSDVTLPPKAWLRAALQGLLPEWVMQRPKRGFSPPVREWHNVLFSRYGRSLVDGYLVQAEVLSSQGARRLSTGEFPRGTVTPLSFKALVLEQWCRGMLERPAT